MHIAGVEHGKLKHVPSTGDLLSAHVAVPPSIAAEARRAASDLGTALQVGPGVRPLHAPSQELCPGDPQGPRGPDRRHCIRWLRHLPGAAASWGRCQRVVDTLKSLCRSTRHPAARARIAAIAGWAHPLSLLVLLAKQGIMAYSSRVSVLCLQCCTHMELTS
jgi:hypothetical protein